jgi:ribA/ribD-fused uncharacterized protein
MSETTNNFFLNDKEIQFYRANGQYGFLSNLSHSKIVLDGIEFQSAEYAYQYAKFRKETQHEKELVNWAMQCPSSSVIAQLGHSLFAWQIVENWNKIKVDRMREVVTAKFMQNPHHMEALKETKGFILVENSKTDNFWGRGSKGKGKNMLGKILMEIRDGESPNYPITWSDPELKPAKLGGEPTFTKEDEEI